jgi:hypothetical protein
VQNCHDFTVQEYRPGSAAVPGLAVQEHRSRQRRNISSDSTGVSTWYCRNIGAGRRISSDSTGVPTWYCRNIGAGSVEIPALTVQEYQPGIAGTSELAGETALTVQEYQPGIAGTSELAGESALTVQEYQPGIAGTSELAGETALTVQEYQLGSAGVSYLSTRYRCQ